MKLFLCSHFSSVGSLIKEEIENKKEKIVVLGDKDAAIEISFFDGGYKYTVFSSMESLNHMFD